jgi:hypothetical protein
LDLTDGRNYFITQMNDMDAGRSQSEGEGLVFPVNKNHDLKIVWDET